MESEYDELNKETAAIEEPLTEITSSEASITESSQAEENSRYEDYYEVIDAAPVPKTNNMAMVSMVMGILSLVLGCCCMGTIFGGLAVLFACLSKTEGKFETKAKAGLIMGIIGIVLTFVMALGLVVLGAAENTQWYDMVRIMIQTTYLV